MKGKIKAKRKRTEELTGGIFCGFFFYILYLTQEPRTVGTLALFVRPSNHFAQIHPHFYHSQQATITSTGVGTGRHI